MSCEDPDCPACIFERAVQSLKDQGFELTDMLELTLHTINEVYGVQMMGFIGEDFIEEETVH